MIPILELCTDSLDVALKGEKAGISRIELCSALSEGGLTPSAGLVQAFTEKLNIPVRVIIRPRTGDFHYSETEFEIMLQDIDYVKTSGANGIVCGILNTDGSIDIKRNLQIVQRAFPMKITFHRAFDVCNNPLRSLEEIIDCGFHTLLSSGQKSNASEGAELLATLVKKAAGRIEIMPGAGLRACHFPEIVNKTQAMAYHGTFTRWVESEILFRRPEIPMGISDHEYHKRDVDIESISKIVNILNNWKHVD
jgi:copper homeostasis protein